MQISLRAANFHFVSSHISFHFKSLLMLKRLERMINSCGPQICIVFGEVGHCIWRMTKEVTQWPGSGWLIDLDKEIYWTWWSDWLDRVADLDKMTHRAWWSGKVTLMKWLTNIAEVSHSPGWSGGLPSRCRSHSGSPSLRRTTPGWLRPRIRNSRPGSDPRRCPGLWMIINTM